MSKEAALTLTQLAGRIAEGIRSALPQPVWVVAEIAAFNHHHSGHAYLELVEYEGESRRELAKMRATIWRRTLEQVQGNFVATTGEELRAGLRILMLAEPSLHPQYGLSLNIKRVDPAFTLGELEAQRRETIARLMAEGVMDLNRELAIPELPRRIAVVSSPTAAGLGDFLKHLRPAAQRYSLRVALFEAGMQGEGAVPSILRALDAIAAEEPQWDVALIMRGGGSRLDLACFDEYELATHAAQFPLPIVSAIGHERDVSVLDMVAHTTVKTPTAAADLIGEIFATAESLLEGAQQTIGRSASNQIARQGTRLDHYPQLFRVATTALLNRLEQQQLSIAQKIQLVNPLRVLTKGYVIPTQGGRRLTSVHELDRQQPLRLTFHDGEVDARPE